MAEAITATGQYLIKHLKEVFEAKGRKVIYGDTDSVFTILAPGEDIEDVIKETNKYLDKHLKEAFRVRDCTIQIALDKKLDKFFIEGKKRYAGEVKGKISITGMECVKRDNIVMATRMQRELIQKIFDKAVPEEIAVWLMKEKQYLETKVDPREITVYKKIGRTNYKLIPLAVKIVRELKERSKGKKDFTESGTIVPYVITNSAKTGMMGIHLSEFNGEFDKAYYWDKLIYAPMERMLKYAYREYDWKQFFSPKPVKIKRESKSPKRPSKKKITTQTEEDVNLQILPTVI